ncbi:hypothetical protein [Parenemella sanctibonifatiensis]|uniref:Uncharacterized protein n=1 Tax=Parenemella sanctibonifatiensis TaxID=2016505 RepID=A0A255E925_9ACTN|nr:hypothetical protein [Parenemella sanctibonifatiensis]OYN88059.1 hypothetical protein CGZ92_05435 [Parenemella sanctibonifatiensis]
MGSPTQQPGVGGPGRYPCPATGVPRTQSRHQAALPAQPGSVGLLSGLPSFYWAQIAAVVPPGRGGPLVGMAAVLVGWALDRWRTRPAAPADLHDPSWRD